MALTTFKPEIWIARLLANLHGRQVYTQAGVVNRDYEGEIRQAGDTVHINSIGAISVRDYAGAVTYDQLTDADLTLVIDQQKYFGFEVDDVDKKQAKPEVMNAATNEGAIALRKVADTFMAGLSVNAGIAGAAAGLGSDAAPLDVSADGAAYELLVDMGVALDDTETPDEGRFAIVSNAFAGLLAKDDRFVKTGSAQAEQRLRNRQIGEAAGFTILKSTNVPTVDPAGEATDNFKLIAGHPMAWSYAEQIVFLEGFRSQDSFADRIRGLHVYGGKVVRPNQLAVAAVKQTITP